MGLYERLFNTSFMAVIQTVFLTAKTKLTEALCQYGVIGLQRDNRVWDLRLICKA